MKKLLGIVVLSLLLNSCTGAGSNLSSISVDPGKVIDMSNSTWKDTRGNYVGMIVGDVTITHNFYAGGKCSYSYWDLIKITEWECEWSQIGDKVKLIRKKWPRGCYEGTISGVMINWREDLKARCKTNKYWRSWMSKAISVTKYVGDEPKKVFKKTTLASKKKTCEEIGFKPNTEASANCILRLMEIEEAKLNRASQKDIAATQSLIEQEIAKKSRDQEAWKVLLGLTLGINNIGSTSSNISSGRAACFKSSETTSGLGKICYYNCMGTIRTINITSMQICPLSANF